jgi:hypothetical protein
MVQSFVKAVEKRRIRRFRQNRLHDEDGPAVIVHPDDHVRASPQARAGAASLPGRRQTHRRWRKTARSPPPRAGGRVFPSLSALGHAEGPIHEVTDMRQDLRWRPARGAGQVARKCPGHITYRLSTPIRQGGQRMSQHHPSRIRRVHELVIRSLCPPYQDGTLGTPGSPRTLPMMCPISFLVSRYSAMLPQFINLFVGDGELTGANTHRRRPSGFRQRH